MIVMCSCSNMIVHVLFLKMTVKCSDCNIVQDCCFGYTFIIKLCMCQVLRYQRVKARLHGFNKLLLTNSIKLENSKEAIIEF